MWRTPPEAYAQTAKPEGPASVLQFVPPEPLDSRAQVVTYAKTQRAWDEMIAMLVDAGHDFAELGEMGRRIVTWREGDVFCTCLGPKPK